MNIKNITKNLTIIMMVVAAVVEAQSCNDNGVCNSDRKYCLQSNDCGTLPYGSCSKPAFCLTNPGIALGSIESGVLYYSEYCSVADSGYTTLNRIDVVGGSPTAIITLDVPYPTILGLYQNTVFYRSNNPSAFLFGVDLSSLAVKKYPLPTGITTIVSLAYNGNIYFAIGLTSSNSYQVLRFDTLSTTSNTASVVYNLGAQVYGVNVVIAPNNGIYFNRNETIYRLDLGVSGAIPTAVTSITSLNDFSYSNGNLYLATSQGLFKYSFSQNIQQRLRPIIESAYFSVEPDSNRLYFNTLYSVNSIDFNGGNNYLISQAQLGLCTCRPNFSGNNCQTCSNGQVQWGDDGYPNCVTKNANGTPVTCNQDYQCGNLPYSICSGNRCACRPNFKGANCKTCDGQVTWSQDGIPSCSS